MAEPRAADWLDAPAALAAILGGVRRLPPVTRPLATALGSVLAEDVVSPVVLPPWDNSAMDGFAVRAADVRGASAGAPRVLTVVDDVAAGGSPARPIGPGQAARIMTGAPVPAGADCVVRVEHTDGGTGFGSAGARVAVLSDADAGRHVRPRGEDVRRGDTVLRAGTVLGAAQVAVAAAVGRPALAVVRRPVVAVLASGDELVEVEDFGAVQAGERIVSTNSYALAAQLAEAGMEARMLGIARDTPESLRAHLERADGCDAVVTSAGISVGEHDHVLRVMEALQTRIAFWRVGIRPGSALAFGTVEGLGGAAWFGLPGNPVSTMVTFELFVRPALLRMAGHARAHLPWQEVRMGDSFGPTGALTHFPRVRLDRRADGGPEARLTGAQGSGVATSMAAADALLVVPPHTTLRPGDAARAVVLGGRPLTERAPF